MDLKLYNKPLSFFQKNILLLFKGTFIAQVVGVAGSLILAKIYGAEAYGAFGVFISISGILAIVNTLQLNNCIITAKTANESKNLTSSLFLIILISTIFSFLTITFLTKVFNLFPSKINIIFLAVIGAIFYSFNKVHESYFTFSQKFKPIANAKIFTAIFNISFQLLLFYKFNFLGLVYGNIISIFLISVYFFNEHKNSLKKIHIYQLKKIVFNNKSILKFILPSSLINTLALNLIPILIAVFFSLKEYGEYFLSIKILAAPLFLISSSVSQVYYQKSAKLYQHSKAKIYSFTKKLVINNLSIMLFILFLINTFGIYFLELLLNKSWDNLRLFTVILSFIVLARSCFNPISDIIIVLNKNHLSLIFNTYLLIINLLAFYIGYKLDNILYFLIILSFFGGIGYFVMLFYFLKKLKNIKKS